jgi:O-antigen/teichoic acid export membrane protein
LVSGMQGGIYAGPRMRRSFRIHVIARFFNLFLAFVLQILVVKTLPVGQYATYAVLLAALMFGQNILSFGIVRTLYRFVPDLTLRGEHRALCMLWLRLGMVRAVALALFLAAIQGGILDWFPSDGLTTATRAAFVVWFLATNLFGDADALAQAWVAHSLLAIATTLEIIIRFVAIVTLFAMGLVMSVELVVMISAATALVALVIITVLLMRVGIELWRNASALETPIPVDIYYAPRFAAAIYVATLAWVGSSAAVVRLVAASGLQALPLAVFSFAQGLLGSLQRGLPGTLVLPALEPIVMANVARGVPGKEIIATLSLVYKLDIVCCLALAIATSVAGGAITRLLATPAYAAYSFVLPVVAGMMIFETAHRIFEIIGNLHLKQRAFLMLWPLGLTSAVAIYGTVEKFGIWSVLAFPMIENVARFCILLAVYRREMVGRALDLERTAEFLAVSLVVIVAGLATREVLGAASDPLALAVACGSVVAMISAILLLHPLRSNERDMALSMIPGSWSGARNVILWLTR